MGRTRLQIAAARRADESRRAIARELRQMREDAGLTQVAVAAAAGIANAYLSQIEAGRREPSLGTLHAIAAVLGFGLSVRLFPNTGPAIRDRFQARIVEAFLRLLDPRWIPHLEVPVERPVRGVIDVVLEDRGSNLLVAVEIHSDLRRVEQQLRWNHQKAEALERADLATPRSEPPAVSRLLILRSTTGTRTLVRDLAATFRTEFPGDPRAALDALRTQHEPWPGPALVWATVRGRSTSLHAGTASRGSRERGGAS